MLNWSEFHLILGESVSFGGINKWNDTHSRWLVRFVQAKPSTNTDVFPMSLTNLGRKRGTILLPFYDGVACYNCVPRLITSKRNVPDKSTMVKYDPGFHSRKTDAITNWPCVLQFFTQPVAYFPVFKGTLFWNKYQFIL